MQDIASDLMTRQWQLYESQQVEQPNAIKAIKAIKKSALMRDEVIFTDDDDIHCNTKDLEHLNAPVPISPKIDQFMIQTRGPMSNG